MKTKVYIQLITLLLLLLWIPVSGSIQRTRTSKLKTAHHLIAGFALSSVLMLGFTLVFLLISAVGWWLAFRYPRRFAPFPGRPEIQRT